MTSLSKPSSESPSGPSSFSSSAPDPSHAGRRYSAPALEKGLEILEALSETTQGYTLRQLAEILERSVNEIFRMLAVLRQADYIQVDDVDRYTLTLKMFHLAHRQPPLKRLMQIAQPMLVELAQRTRQSCHLALYQQGKVVVIGQADSPERWLIGMKLGAMMGLTDTSSGHVLLAYQDEVGRSRMLSQRVRVEGEAETDPGHLLALLAEVRRTGCSVMPSAQVRGVTNIAYPVWSADGTVVAAVNVPHTERIDQMRGPSIEEIKRIQAEICGRMSRMLGATDPDL